MSLPALDDITAHRGTPDPIDGVIRVEDMPFTVEGVSDEVGEDLKDALQQFERQHILYSLRRHNYDKNDTAKHLGIGVSSLYRKMDELNIPKNVGEPAG